MSEKIKTPEEKRAEFKATAQRNKENFELHKILISKHFDKVDDLMLLKLISYAEEYHNTYPSQFPSPQEVTDESDLRAAFEAGRAVYLDAKEHQIQYQYLYKRFEDFLRCETSLMRSKLTTNK